MKRPLWAVGLIFGLSQSLGCGDSGAGGGGNGGAGGIAGSSGVGGAAGTGSTDAGAGADGAVGTTNYTATAITASCDDLTSGATTSIIPLVHVTDSLPLPSTFSFFGQPQTHWVVAETGMVFLFPGTSVDITVLVQPQRAPDPQPPNGWIAAFWDFHTAYDVNRSSVRYGSFGSGPDQRFVLEFHDFTMTYPVIYNPQIHLTMQIKLFASTGVIEIHYCDVTAPQEVMDRVSGSDAEVGIESPDGTAGVSAAFDATGTVATGRGWRFAPRP
jgi:hypothetical protein